MHHQGCHNWDLQRNHPIKSAHILHRPQFFFCLQLHILQYLQHILQCSPVFPQEYIFYFTLSYRTSSPPIHIPSYRPSFFLRHEQGIISSNLTSHRPFPGVFPTIDLSSHLTYHPPFRPILHIQTTILELNYTFPGLACG